MPKLQGKVEVVTGGSSGMGLATAKRFVDEGAFVYITGRRFPNLQRWFETVRAGPATIRAYLQGEPYSTRPAVTEEGKKIRFGQTAAGPRAQA
jgi:NAD(P)-dependent dehydrogenase (short-subunit alcohol dehydrogenase family)